jgi:drug/metabolite transporter (DMT)-like permease
MFIIEMPKTKWWAIVLMFCCTGFTAFGQLFMKKGSATNYVEVANMILSQQIFSNIITILTDPNYASIYFIIAGVTMYSLAAGFNITSLKGGELSVLFPVFATNYIWVLLLSAYVLGEPMNLLKWFGVGGIVLGISLIGYGSEKIYRKTKIK